MYLYLPCPNSRSSFYGKCIILASPRKTDICMAMIFNVISHHSVLANAKFPHRCVIFHFKLQIKFVMHFTIYRSFTIIQLKSHPALTCVCVSARVCVYSYATFDVLLACFRTFQYAQINF